MNPDRQRWRRGFGPGAADGGGVPGDDAGRGADVRPPIALRDITLSKPIKHLAEALTLDIRPDAQTAAATHALSNYSCQGE